MLTQAFSSNYKLLLHSSIITIVCLVLVSCAATNRRDQQHSDVTSNFITKDGHTMHYASSGVDSDTAILFIHGTPGSWTAFADFLNNKELQNYFFMVSVDRLNWGLSSQHADFDFATQASAINSVMQQHPNKQWLIVGHSLGASIAPLLALNSSNSITALVLLAGTLSPELGAPRWYNRLSDNRIVNWLLPTSLKKANTEIMALQTELANMHQQILDTRIDSHLVVIQGMKDKLVSPKNTHFIDQNWGENFNKLTIIELDTEGHFLPWRQTKLISEQLKQLGLSPP